MIRLVIVALGLLSVGGEALAAEVALSEKEMGALLETIDSRMRFPFDYSAKIFMQQKRKGREDRVFELQVLRRDKDDALIILFSKPKTEVGKGYMRIDRNLWYYDPTTGKWERETERLGVGGTDARRRDFDDWDLAETYVPTYVGREKLGAFDAHKLRLTAKPDADVAFPVLNLSVDVKTGDPLKIEYLAASGRLAQTTFYPQWVVRKSTRTGRDVHYPKETRLRNDLEDGQQTILLVREVEEQPLPPNTFTKAWLETQSR